MTTKLQSSITVKIESFGAIERQLPQDLTVQCQIDSLVADVLNKVIQSFPEAFNLLEHCACAIGEDIISRQTRLNQDSTLVLLSPVAGG